MAILVWLLAAGWLVVWLAPETPLARLLHQYLVATPAAQFNRIGRRHVQVAGVLMLMFLAASWLGQDASNIARMASPEVAMMLASIDLSVVLDIVVTVALTWSAGRIGGKGSAMQALRRGFGRISGTRFPRSRRAPRTTEAANDDDDRRWAWAA